MNRLTKKSLREIVLEVIDEADKMSTSYKLKNRDKHNVEKMWFTLVKNKRKKPGDIKDYISKKLKINYFEVSSYIDKNILGESVAEADNGKPFPGKKDDEKKDKEDPKIAVPSDNPYDKEVNERNDTRISEKKLREFVRAVIREAVKFDQEKMKNMMVKDRFLQKAFKAIKGKDSKKFERLFNTFVVGDSSMERIYKKA